MDTHAETKTENISMLTRKKHGIPSPQEGPKWAAPLGLVILLLAVFGLVSIVLIVVNHVNNSRSKEFAESAGYYEQLLTPVVMVEPVPFENIEKADKLYLVKASIVSILLDESVELPYDINGLMMVSADLVETKCRQLFGNDIKLEHKSFFLEAILFRYNDSDNSYHIPATGLNGKYRPKVVDISKKKGEICVRVDLYETESENLGAGCMNFRFADSKDGNYIKSIEYIEQ
ncbi:MAG TPA: hypothetical protein GXX17_03965 [Clostridiales bacterium]|nr:hypothetical protein [Clostridiales bacterium]